MAEIPLIKPEAQTLLRRIRVERCVRTKVGGLSKVTFTGPGKEAVGRSVSVISDQRGSQVWFNLNFAANTFQVYSPSGGPPIDFVPGRTNEPQVKEVDVNRLLQANLNWLIGPSSRAFKPFCREPSANYLEIHFDGTPANQNRRRLIYSSLHRFADALKP